MEPLLYLCHRIPYPPNKGDKIRSFNLLRYLAERYRVYLGTFVDDAADEQHVPALERWCAGVHAVRLDPRRSKLRSLTGLLSGEALTLPYYRDASMKRWVEQTLALQGVGKAVVFSSAMAQYVMPDGNGRSGHRGLHTVVDLVDVDSAKWTQYARERTWPTSVVYRREGRRLLDFERRVVAASYASVLVTEAEVDLLRQLAPEAAPKLHAIENGVDSGFFSPEHAFDSPYAGGEAPLVFTGVMDYWPNVDAAHWFARDILPRIAARVPNVRFYVVGMNPAPAVRELAADPRVVVTGKVADVRPYLKYSAVVVAPLRVARGVQNKVLEAMAMGRPVVSSTAAANGVSAQVGVEFDAAADADAFAERVLRVLDPAVGAEMGRRARARVLNAYDWDAKLQAFEGLLDDRQAAAASLQRAH